MSTVKTATKKALRKTSPHDFLQLFYPFHYQVGSTIETALRGSDLSQHQTVILWIIHSEGDSGRVMRRKDIEQRISSWFDVTSSAISKALRSLARADKPFLEISEDPNSGREKLVTLTRAGQKEIGSMIKRTEAFIGRIVDELTIEEIRAGLVFMARVSQVVPALKREDD
ncbi:MAG: winged helix DNA-binding protein [Pseudomonadota bacterium]